VTGFRKERIPEMKGISAVMAGNRETSDPRS
jgi:hypothetical protein